MMMTPVLTTNAAGEVPWPTQPSGFVLVVSEGPTQPMPWQEADMTGRTEQNGFYKQTVPLTGTNRCYRLFRQ